MKYLICIALITVYVNCTLIYHEWGDWSPCYNSTTGDKDDLVHCGGGITVRFMSCFHVEADLDFFCKDTQTVCNQQPCYDPYENEAWSKCSEECGGGKRSIEGVDINGGFVSMEIDCHNQECENNNNIYKPVDIVIALDSSGSIGSNWIILKQFIIDLIKGLQIKTPNSRISVITYSNKVEDIIELGSSTDIETLCDLIWDLEYITGGTHTSDALAEMKNQFESFHQASNNSMVGLVISDAMSNIDMDLTIPNAQLVKDMNVTMLGIGVGEEFDRDEMGRITSDSNNLLFEAGNFTSLKNLVDTVIDKIVDPYVNKICTACDTSGFECDANKCGIEGEIRGVIHCTNTNYMTSETTEHDENCENPCTIPCTQVGCNRCDFTKGQIWRPNPENCHEYFICEPLNENLEYRIHTMSCGNMYWDQESFTCIEKVTGECVVGVNVTVAPENITEVACHLSIYNGDDTRFWINGQNHTIIVCPLGLFFNESDSACACEYREGVSVPTNICEDDLLLHFSYEDHYNDVTCHNANAIEYGSGLTIADGMACFNGSSYLEVPFMINWFSGKNIQAFSIEMNYTTISPAPGLAGIVNNGDCKEHPSFAFSTVVNNDATNDIYGQIDTSVTGIERSVSESIDDTTWVHMVWVYNGNTLSIYKNNGLVSEIPVNGNILNTQVPMRIGTICEESSQQDNFFNGCIEDLKIWNKVISV